MNTTTINTDAAIAAGRALGRAAGATYCAGRACGRWWHRCAVPAVLRAADGASWTLSQIDWAEALGITVEGLKALVALVITVAICAHQHLLQGSERLGRWWSALLLQGRDRQAPGAPAAATTTAVPIGAGVAVEAPPRPPAGRRDRRRVHSPGLARWAASADAEPPLWWSV